MWKHITPGMQASALSIYFLDGVTLLRKGREERVRIKRDRKRVKEKETRKKGREKTKAYM